MLSVDLKVTLKQYDLIAIFQLKFYQILNFFFIKYEIMNQLLKNYEIKNKFQQYFEIKNKFEKFM